MWGEWRFLILLFFFSLPAFAATDSEVLSRAPSRDILYSDQYFLSATRSLQKINRVTDHVEVITREELDRWPVSDLDEALGMINGVVVQDDGNIGQVATAQIYGSKPREVRVMVDGITFNPTTSGGIADLSQIPLDMVEKIEIIKGASSSVWGSAMGGVINIVTRPVGKSWVPRGSTTVAFGEFGTQRERGEVSGLLGPLRYYGFGSHVESNGFRANSDEWEQRAFLKAELPLTDELVFANSFGYSHSKISEFDLPAPVSQSAKRKVLSRYGSSGFIYSPSENVHVDLFYKLSERTFRREARTFPARSFIRMIKTQSMIHEISTTGVWDFTENQTLVLGSDVGVEVYRDADFRATTNPINVAKQSMRHAYYGNYQLSWWKLDTTLGLRGDATNHYGLYVSPSAGAVFHLPFWDSHLKANVSRAFNAPSLVDRYQTSGTMIITIPNPDLEAEKAIVYNLGFETEPYSGVRFHGTFFQTFLKDSILTITRDDGFRQPVNTDRERRTGFEAGGRLGPWWGFSPSYGVTYVLAKDGEGVVLSSRPRLTHDIKLNYYTVLAGLELNAHISGRHMDLVQYSSSGFTAPIDQTFIFDAKILLTFPSVVYGRVSLFVECENLLNEDFSFDGERDPNPQRNLEAGAQFKF